jgi:peptidoglycan/LPS O-acetylase OafA/YrhL
MSRRTLDIPSLDGLRAVSILIVFASHAGWERIIPGGFGVTVFFVLSGYLIMTLLRVEFERTRAIDLRAFYVRRAFRILPLSYLVLTMVLVGNVAGALGSGEVWFWPTFSQYLQATNIYAVFVAHQPFMPGTGVYWSLSIEEHFYLVLPFAALVMARRGWPVKRQANTFVAICAAVLAWRCVLVFALNATVNRTYYATDTRIDSLLFGCAAALIANPVLDRTDVNVERSRILAWFGLGAIAVSFVVRDDAFRETIRYTVQSVAVVWLMRWVVLSPTSILGRPLNLKPLVWLGRLSYGFYLIHQVVIFEVSKHVTASVPMAAIALVASMAGCWLLHRVVDPPAYRRRDRILHRTDQVTA